MAARSEIPPKAIHRTSRHPLVGIVAAGIGTGLLSWIPVVRLCETPPGKLASMEASSTVERPATAPLRLSVGQSDLATNSTAILVPDSKSLSLGPERVARDQGALNHYDAAKAGPALLSDGTTSSTVRPPAAETADSEPRRMPPENGASDVAATRVRVADEGALKDGEVRPARLVVHEPIPVSVVPPTASEPTTSAASDHEGGTIRLMHELHSDDAAIAEEAQRELSKRGFTETHLQLARKLTSHNPEERAQLAARLPGVPGIDARLWLTWLLRDDSPRVRAAALSVLATTGDPETLRRVLEIARQDRDPAVRALLNNIDKSLRAGR